MPLYAGDLLIRLTPSVDCATHKAFRRGTQAAGVIDYCAANFASKPEASRRPGLAQFQPINTPL
jgi:hypothetical protein